MRLFSFRPISPSLRDLMSTAPSLNIYLADPHGYSLGRNLKPATTEFLSRYCSELRRESTVDCPGERWQHGTVLSGKKSRTGKHEWNLYSEVHKGRPRFPSCLRNCQRDFRLSLATLKGDQMKKSVEKFAGRKHKKVEQALGLSLRNLFEQLA